MCGVTLYGFYVFYSDVSRTHEVSNSHRSQEGLDAGHFLPEREDRTLPQHPRQQCLHQVRKYFKQTRIFQRKYSRVFPNGDVLYSIRISLTLSCPMNLKLYPMDRQTCALKVRKYFKQKKIFQRKYFRSPATATPRTTSPTSGTPPTRSSWPRVSTCRGSTSRSTPAATAT